MSTILVNFSNGVATLKFNRPSRANALTSEMGNLLIENLEKFALDDQVRVVVLTGEGIYFCTGMDLSNKGGGALDPELLFRTLLTFPKPLISLINGAAYGGGWGIIFCTDIRICDPSATFSFAEVKRGLAPAFISSFIVPQIGTFLSKDLMLTGRKITAIEAKSMNLVTAVGNDSSDTNTILDGYIKELIQGGPSIQKRIKETITFISQHNQEESLAHVRKLFKYMITSEEATFGMKSFIEKREPDWSQMIKSKI